MTAWGDKKDDGIRGDEIDDGIRDDEIDDGIRGDEMEVATCQYCSPSSWSVTYLAVDQNTRIFFRQDAINEVIKNKLHFDLEIFTVSFCCELKNSQNFLRRRA